MAFLWDWISVRFQGKAFNITVIQVYAPTSNAEEAEIERFYVTFYFPALEKAMATHSSVLAWRIPGMGEPCGCHLWGHTEWDTRSEEAHV